MPTINLLPWREKMREAKKRHFVQLFATCLVTTLTITIAVHFVFTTQVKKQNRVNIMLQNEINQLDVKIVAVNNMKEQRDSLLSRMRVIQSLQQSRPLTVKLFDAVTRSLPDGVYLTQFSRQNVSLMMKGRAESNTRVSELMRALEQSPYFGFPQLTEIVTDRSKKLDKNAFELMCTQQTG